MRLRAGLLVVSLQLASVAASTGEARADQAAHKRALDLFDLGKIAYQEGRFADAVALLERAYAIEPAPVLLYNMARAYEGSGNFEKAIDAYARYLAQAEKMPDRPAIEARVESLRGAVAEKERLARERDEANARRARTPPPLGSREAGDAPSDRPSDPSPAPWIIAGVGGAGLAAAAIVGGVALAKHGDATDAPDQRGAFDLQSSAEDLGLASTVLFVAGGAVAAVGVTWGIIDVASSGDGATVEAAFVGTGFVVRGTF